LKKKKRIFNLNKIYLFLVVVATPSINSLILLSTLFFFQGISQGTTDLGLFF